MAERRLLSLLVVGIRWPPETFLARLLGALADEGVNITVASDSRPDSAWLAHPSVRWLSVPAWERSAVHRLMRLVWWRAAALLRPLGKRDMHCFSQYVAQDTSRVARLRRWNQLLPFAGRRWDVIYFPWNSAAVTYRPLFEMGVPVVISCRGSQINVAPHNPEQQGVRKGLEETLPRAAAVHCVSQAIADEAHQYGLEAHRAWVIRPAIDPHFFRPEDGRRSEAAGEFRIVSTGSLIWRKGYEYALTAVRNLIDRGLAVYFDIIGNGPERARVLYTIHDLGLVNQVRLWGHLPPDAVRGQLRKADVFLLSSLSEGISNAVLEAMACGLPLVTTDCGGMDEVITNGVEGFLVPPRDPVAMADALCQLQQSPEQRRRMGQAARQRIFRQQLILDRQAAAFHMMIRSVVHTHDNDLVRVNQTGRPAVPTSPLR